MNSYHEFSLIAQMSEYIVGLVSLMLFVPFWRLVSRKPKSKARV